MKVWMIATLCAMIFAFGCAVVKNPETGKVDKERMLLAVKTVLNIYGEELPDPNDLKAVKCFKASKSFVNTFQNSTDMLVILHDYSVVKRDCKGVVDVNKIWGKIK